MSNKEKAEKLGRPRRFCTGLFELLTEYIYSDRFIR